MFSSSKEVKHVACSRCRERKVKCDGVKPVCRRCERQGHACQYTNTRKRYTKNDWAQHMRTFSAHPGKTNRLSSELHQTSQSMPSCSRGQEAFVNDAVESISRSPSPHDLINRRDPSNLWTGHNLQYLEDSRSSVSQPTSVHVIDESFLDPNLYNFSSASTYWDTNYISNDFTTYSGSVFPTVPTLRSNTPISQASEAPSFAGGGLGSFPNIPYAQPPVLENTDQNQHYPTSFSRSFTYM